MDLTKAVNNLKNKIDLDITKKILNEDYGISIKDTRSSANISSDKKVEAVHRAFNKEFGCLKNLDIISEYTKVLLKISKQSSNVRKKLVSYVQLRCVQDPNFKSKIDELHSNLLKTIKK